MWIQNKKLIECPHCRNTRFYKDWSEFEKHKRGCPGRFVDPRRRFKAKILFESKNQNIHRIFQRQILRSSPGNKNHRRSKKDC